MKKSRIKIEVWADWSELKEITKLGILYAAPAQSGQLFSFEYDNDWLRSNNAKLIDPSLDLFKGEQYPSPDKETFGIFLDSSPDRWGRALMRKRE